MASSSGTKRRADGPLLEQLEFTPLGGGEEVGRSCLILRYKGKTIMLDCGVLPAMRGMNCLPALQVIEPAEIDIVFITHFHLDHAAALPYFTQRLSGFRGRIFATHATISCMRLMLLDYIRIAAIGGGDARGGSSSSSSRPGAGKPAAVSADSAAPEPEDLYDVADLEACLRRMEVADFRQRISVDGASLCGSDGAHEATRTPVADAPPRATSRAVRAHFKGDDGLRGLRPGRSHHKITACGTIGYTAGDLGEGIPGVAMAGGQGPHNPSARLRCSLADALPP